MYIFKLKLSEKARGYCMYVFLVLHEPRATLTDIISCIHYLQYLSFIVRLKGVQENHLSYNSTSQLIVIEFLAIYQLAS